MRFFLLFNALFGLLSGCLPSTSINKQHIIKGILLKTKELNYPSGSALAFRNDTLYLMGDDAPELLIVDTTFNELKKVSLFTDTTERLSKVKKADIESAAFIDQQQRSLVLFGSGSVSPMRDSLFIVDLATGSVKRYQFDKGFRKLLEDSNAELNIEGAAQIDTVLLFASRSNLKSKQNYLISNYGQILRPSKKNKIITLNIEESSFGVSGLDYYKEEDLLLLTFSSEATQSAYADGEIGNSAVGLVRNISKKLDSDSIGLDAWIPLSAIDARFDKMKVESVAVTGKEKAGLILYLVADNDNGKSTLFKVRLLE